MMKASFKLIILLLAVVLAAAGHTLANAAITSPSADAGSEYPVTTRFPSDITSAEFQRLKQEAIERCKNTRAVRNDMADGKINVIAQSGGWLEARKNGVLSCINDTIKQVKDAYKKLTDPISIIEGLIEAFGQKIDARACAAIQNVGAHIAQPANDIRAGVEGVVYTMREEANAWMDRTLDQVGLPQYYDPPKPNPNITHFFNEANCYMFGRCSR